MFVADLTEKRCFVACSKEKQDRGQCSCINRMGTVISGGFSIQNIRKYNIERILKSIDPI
jgi:hypothetical protein